MLFWKPPSYFFEWRPSPFVIDNASYSCEGQYMMAENTRFFQDHGAAELDMSSPYPHEHKHISRGVRKTQLRYLGPYSGRSRPCCHFWQVHTIPRHEPAHLEHWHQLFG